VITRVNPGTRLELVGSFALTVPGLEGAGPEVLAVDRESGRVVTLAGLFRSFLEDPDDRITGLVRVTIEPAGFNPSQLRAPTADSPWTLDELIRIFG
jgi:hypothetical protein